MQGVRVLGCAFVVIWTGNVVFAGERYETCYFIKIEGTFVRDGDIERMEETCFTAAELPWTALELSVQDDLVGFVPKRERVEMKFQGNSLLVDKVTWKRSPRLGPCNISADSVRFWLSETMATPPLRIALGFRRPELDVPPGCVKFEVLPHSLSADEISEYEMGNTLAARGKCTSATTCRIGEKTVPAHEFRYSVTSDRHTLDGRLIVSQDIPGGIGLETIRVNHDSDGEMERSMRIVGMSAAPLPEPLDKFADHGFSFAAPRGYQKAAQPKVGELVRYVKGSDAFLSVTLIELGDGRLSSLYQKLLEKRACDGSGQIFSVGRDEHVAGHPTFTMWDDRADVAYIHAEHAGKGYRIAISRFGHMKASEVRSLLRGWRWIEREDNPD